MYSHVVLHKILFGVYIAFDQYAFFCLTCSVRLVISLKQSLTLSNSDGNFTGILLPQHLEHSLVLSEHLENPLVLSD